MNCLLVYIIGAVSTRYKEFSIYLGYGQAYEQNRGGILPKDYAKCLYVKKRTVFDTNIKSPTICSYVEIGKQDGLKIRWRNPYRFKSYYEHQNWQVTQWLEW